MAPSKRKSNLSTPKKGSRKKAKPATRSNPKPKPLPTPLARALAQRLFYLSHISQAATESFLVTGNSGKLYTVQLSPTIKCNCPDHIFRRRPCKHILFLLYRVLSLPIPKQMPTLQSLNNSLPDVSELLDTIHVDAEERAPDAVIDAVRGIAPELFNSTRKIAPKRGSSQDECPVCMDALAQSPVDHCASCGNGIHHDCIQRYRRAVSGAVRCVLCRAEWDQADATVGKKGVLKAGRLINVSDMVDGVFEPDARRDIPDQVMQMEENPLPRSTRTSNRSRAQTVLSGRVTKNRTNEKVETQKLSREERMLKREQRKNASASGRGGMPTRASRARVSI